MLGVRLWRVRITYQVKSGPKLKSCLEHPFSTKDLVVEDPALAKSMITTNSSRQCKWHVQWCQFPVPSSVKIRSICTSKFVVMGAKSQSSSVLHPSIKFPSITGHCIYWRLTITDTVSRRLTRSSAWLISCLFFQKKKIIIAQCEPVLVNWPATFYLLGVDVKSMYPISVFHHKRMDPSKIILM